MMHYSLGSYTGFVLLAAIGLSSTAAATAVDDVNPVGVPGASPFGPSPAFGAFALSSVQPPEGDGLKFSLPAAFDGGALLFATSNAVTGDGAAAGEAVDEPGNVPSIDSGVGGARALNGEENMERTPEHLMSPERLGTAMLDGMLGVLPPVESTGWSGGSGAFFTQPPEASPVSQTPIPEPATVALLGMGLTFLAARRARIKA